MIGTWSLTDRRLESLDEPTAGVKLGDEGHFVSASAEDGRLTLLRDPSGGERIYFRVDGGKLTFSSSIKPLLGPLDPEVAFERGLAELAHFGDRTVVAGVREVLPGHRLVADEKGVRQEWAYGELLEPVAGDAATLRARLKAAVARCINGRAAVALSGGIDSGSVAALACELVGPDKVEAFTYEYDDPGHPSEVEAAKAMAQHLGIRKHHHIKISFEDFVNAAPLAVWSAEDPGYWKRSYPVMLSRAVKAAGHDRFLTGFGIGSHMAELGERAAFAQSAPKESLPAWLKEKPPVFRLYYPLVTHLRARGLLRDLTPLFPDGLGARVEAGLPRMLEALRGTESWPLERLLRFQFFTHMNSCADVVRCERVARETGAAWLGPAHFPSVLPYCYLPSADDGGLRPGKRLLREAMKETLPSWVMRQKKDWTQTIGSRAWRDRVLARMDKAGDWEPLREVFGDSFAAAKAWAPEGMIPLAFWRRVLFSGKKTWEELGC